MLLNALSCKAAPVMGSEVFPQIERETPENDIITAQSSARVLLNSLSANAKPDFEVVVRAFLDARTLDSGMFLLETYEEEKFPPSVRDVVQASLLHTSFLLLAAAAQTGKDQPKIHKGADGKLRNDKMVYEGDAFQVFSWCRARAIRYESPLPHGSTATDFYQSVERQSIEVFAHAQQILSKNEAAPADVSQAFDRTADLVVFLLDATSRFDRHEQPIAERSGIFRSRDKDRALNSDTKPLNRRRICAFDASHAFKVLIQLERRLSDS